MKNKNITSFVNVFVHSSFNLETVDDKSKKKTLDFPASVFVSSMQQLDYVITKIFSFIECEKLIIFFECI